MGSSFSTTNNFPVNPPKPVQSFNLDDQIANLTQQFTVQMLTEPINYVSRCRPLDLYPMTTDEYFNNAKTILRNVITDPDYIDTYECYKLDFDHTIEPELCEVLYQAFPLIGSMEQYDHDRFINDYLDWLQNAMHSLI